MRPELYKRKVVDSVGSHNNNDPAWARFGPFSKDFRWVHLSDWPHGPILLTEGQSAVFRALWYFRGLPRNAEAVMEKAGLASQKPADLFKIKVENKGDPVFEGPLRAYRTLVEVRRRSRTYALRSAVTWADPD